MLANLFPQDIRTVALTTSTEDITRYVATTGSDVTGDGSVAHPYATVTRAYQDFPYRMAHKGKILIAAGDYPAGTMPRTFDTIFVNGGTLEVVGVGVPRVVSGPHSITGISVKIAGTMTRLAVAAAAWTDDELCGQFLVIKTGAHPGASYQVWGNGSNWIDVQDYATSLNAHNGDTFDLIRPAVKIACPEGMTIMYQNFNGLESSIGIGGNSRFILHNLWLDASTSTALGEIFSVRSFGNGLSSVMMQFVLLEGPSSAPYNPYGLLDLVDSGINAWTAYVDDFIADGGTGLLGMDNVTESPGLSVHDARGRDAYSQVVTCGNCSLAAFAATGKLNVYHGEIQLLFTSFGGIQAYAGISSGTFYGRLDATAGEAAFTTFGIVRMFMKVYCERGTYVVECRSSCDLQLEDCVCSATGVTGQAIAIANVCHIATKGSMTNFVGAGAGGGGLHLPDDGREVGHLARREQDGRHGRLGLVHRAVGLTC